MPKHNEPQYKTKANAIVSAESLTKGDKVAWLYTTPKLVEALQKPEETFTYVQPEEWIDMDGESDSGWIVIRTKKYESMFHAPSVFKYMLRR